MKNNKKKMGEYHSFEEYQKKFSPDLFKNSFEKKLSETDDPQILAIEAVRESFNKFKRLFPKR